MPQPNKWYPLGEPGHKGAGDGMEDGDQIRVDMVNSFEGMGGALSQLLLLLLWATDNGLALQ